MHGDEIGGSREWDNSGSCMTMTSIRDASLAACFPSQLNFPKQQPMLTLNHVIKHYGALTALNDVSLDIASGEFFGLLGPNGAGKTTLMSFVTGLRAPDAGRITINGQPVSAVDSSTRATLGLLPQSIALYEDLSAEQNLRIFGELYDLR